jgi:hypothetical protein
MDIDNLPEGLYYDPIHGEIEDFRGAKARLAPASNDGTIIYSENSLGIVDAAYDIDELKYQYLAVAKANTQNANERYVDFYSAAPNSNDFQPIPNAQRWTPRIKIDTVKLRCVGEGLVCLVVEHAPREAPRDSFVEKRPYEDVCFVKTTPREGPCGPNNLPYYRPGNNLTRGQVSKIIVEALEATGFQFPAYDPTVQVFEDVPVGSAFHEYAAKLAAVGAIGGYACVPQ